MSKILVEDFTHILPEDKPARVVKATSDKIYDLAIANAESLRQQRRNLLETIFEEFRGKTISRLCLKGSDQVMVEQDNYFQNIQDNMPDNYVFRYLFRLLGSNKESLFWMVNASPNDEQIQTFIANKFGIYGGGSIEDPKGWYEYSGGKNPRLEFQDPDFKTTEKLEGRKLVDAFRLLYKIPRGGQQSLF